MEKRRFMKDNKGYTLIEMIIVIAIIAIMTGAAMVTITILHNAKAKEASITLETALSETQKNAKGKMCVVADTQQPDYKFALAVYKSGSKYYVKKGYYIGNGNDMSLNSSYVFDDSENANSGKGESFSAYVKVKYKDSSGTEQDITGNVLHCLPHSDLKVHSAIRPNGLPNPLIYQTCFYPPTILNFVPYGRNHFSLLY